MLPFLYRCPVTGLNVQGLGIDKPHLRNGTDMRTVMCLACRRIHIVKPLPATDVTETEKQVDPRT